MKKEKPQELRDARGFRENAKSDDQIPGKQTLEPFLPTNWEKIPTY